MFTGPYLFNNESEQTFESVEHQLMDRAVYARKNIQFSKGYTKVNKPTVTEFLFNRNFNIFCS